MPAPNELSSVPGRRRPQRCQKQSALRYVARGFALDDQPAQQRVVDVLALGDCGQAWGEPAEPKHFRRVRSMSPEQVWQLIGPAIDDQLDGEVVPERVRKLNATIDRDFAALSASWPREQARLQAAHEEQSNLVRIKQRKVLRQATAERAVAALKRAAASPAR